VVIEPIAPPVALDHRHVEVPALNLGLSSGDDLGGSGTERDGRQPRGTTQRL
jgi:hypothetical protein